LNNSPRVISGPDSYWYLYEVPVYSEMRFSYRKDLISEGLRRCSISLNYLIINQHRFFSGIFLNSKNGCHELLWHPAIIVRAYRLPVSVHWADGQPILPI